jgi:hypothetical protein
MMKRIRVLKLAAVLLIFVGVVPLGSHYAFAATCTDLIHSTVPITANGDEGMLEFNPNISLPSISGTIQFTGEARESFTGTCNGRHVVFSRIRWNVFSQVYDGWISTKQNTKQLAGMFSHGQSNQRWPWGGSWTETAK